MRAAGEPTIRQGNVFGDRVPAAPAGLPVAVVELHQVDVSTGVEPNDHPAGRLALAFLALLATGRV